MTRWNQDQYDAYMSQFNKNVVPYHPETMVESDEGLESDLQRKCNEWLDARGYPYLSFKKSIKAKGFLKPGWPDMTIILPKNKTIFIEFKNKNGRLSADQKEMRLKMLYLEHDWYECRSFSKFKEIISNYV